MVGGGIESDGRHEGHVHHIVSAATMETARASVRPQSSRTRRWEMFNLMGTPLRSGGGAVAKISRMVAHIMGKGCRKFKFFGPPKRALLGSE